MTDQRPPTPSARTESTVTNQRGITTYVPHAITRRYTGSFAEQFWNRLSVTDFMSKAIMLAAILLLCFIQFTFVVSAFTGRTGDVTGLVRRLGLNHEAARDVSAIFAPAHATTSSISGAGYVLFILGGIAAASAIQDLYEKVYGLDALGMKNLVRQLAWLAWFIGGSLLVAAVAPSLHRLGGQGLLWALGFVVWFVGWWVSMWLFTAGRVAWRELFPSAVATAVCWTGMYAVFHLVFSSSITSDYKKYGPIGVVLALMSFFIAIGVVIVLGAVFGIVWRERKSRPGAEMCHSHKAQG